MKLALLLFHAVSGLAMSVQACLDPWEMPRNHFDGVNNRGYVDYYVRMGNLDLGEGLMLPLVVNFDSERGSSSPFVGKGWVIGLLDSNFVQTGEDLFQLMQPNTALRPFYRTKSGGNILNGGPSWKAEIKGDIIVAYVTCGWKFTYRKGRLVSMGTPKGRRLDYIYTEGRLSEIREGSVTRLNVDYDPTTGLAQALRFQGKRVEVGLAERPRVQVVAGQTMVGGVDPSLNRLSGALEGEAWQFDFAVDENIQPTLRISGGGAPERTYVWNAATKHVLAEDGWTYDIKPGLSKGESAAIGRTKVDGVREFWHLDGAKGAETVITAAGARVVKTWFTSGRFAGKLRKREVILGESVSVYSVAYDEEGRMLRSSDHSGDYLYSRDRKSGAAITRDMRTQQTLISDPKTHTVELKTPCGKVIKYVYDPETKQLTLPKQSYDKTPIRQNH